MTFVPQEIEPGLRAWLAERPWWERTEPGVEAQLRVGDRALAEVVAALRSVYDSPTVERMCNGVERSLVIPLHALGAGMMVGGQLLALGLDLVDDPLDREDHKLRSDLRAIGSWWGARVEIGVRAGLRRHGVTVRRPPIPRDKRQYDFDLCRDQVCVALECKSFSIGDRNVNARVVREAFEGFVGVPTPEGQLLDGRFTASPRLAAALSLRPAKFMREVAPDYFAAMRLAVDAAARSGTPSAVGAFGTIEVAARDATDLSGPYGLEVRGIAGDAADRVLHLATQLTDAGAQLRRAPPGAHRVAVVWIGSTDESGPVLADRFGEMLGREVEFGGGVVDLRRTALGVDTVILLAGSRAWRVRDTGRILTAIVPVDATVPRLPAWVLEGVRAWREVARLERDRAG